MRKKSSQRPRIQFPVQRNDCRSLIWLDSTPQRQEASAQYAELKEKIARAVARIEHFEEQILPEFERWHAQSFGPLLTRQRSLYETYQDKLTLVQEVEQEQWARGGSMAQAYRRVLQARACRAAHAEGSNAGPESSEGPRAETPFDTLFREMVRDLFGIDVEQLDPAQRELMEKALRRDMGMEEPADAAPPPPPRRRRQERAAPSKHSSVEGRCKQIYRVLARLLHPDTCGETTFHARQLWNDLQDAWQRRDLERLEILQAMVELHEGGKGQGATFAEVALGQLQQIVRELAGTWRDIQKRQQSLILHPASQLADPKKAGRLESKIRSELLLALRTLEMETEDLEQLLQMWSHTQARKSKRIPRVQVEFGF